MSIRFFCKFLINSLRFGKLVVPEASILTVANDADRSFYFNGKYYSPVIDSIEGRIKKEGIRCIGVARILNSIVGKRAYGEVYAPPGVFERALIEKRLRRLLRSNSYPFSRLEYRAWLKILKKTSAKKVLGILPSRELCLACHRNGIWIADIQHGANSGLEGDSEYYNAKMRATEPRDWHPDAFWCWDQGSREIICKWSDDFRDIDVVVIGNPWLNRFAIDRLFVEEMSKAFKYTCKPDDMRPSILVTLQWGCTEIENGVMHQSIIDVVRQTSSDYRWLIRLHPVQLRGVASREGVEFQRIFDTQLKEHAEWEWATLSPLPLVLKDVDLHITWHSSTTIEAAFMGIASCLLNPELRKGGAMAGMFDYFVNQGVASFVNPTVGDILQWMEMDRKHLNSETEMNESLRNYNLAIGELLSVL